MTSRTSGLLGLIGSKGKSKSLGLGGALGGLLGGRNNGSGAAALPTPGDAKPNEFGGGGKPAPPRGRSRTLTAFGNNASSMMRGSLQ